MATLHEKAERLRALHVAGKPVVFVNAWDVASARIIESVGYDAVATTSAGIAFAQGFPDGGSIGRDRMLAVVAQIAHAVSVPVTADVESGYGPSVEDAEETANATIEAGAVGMNFEDGVAGKPELMDADTQAERIRAIRHVGERRGVPLVINARIDAIFNDVGEESSRMAETIRRAHLYRDAGVDCIFVPGVTDRDEIVTLVDAIGVPLNVLAWPGALSIPELAKLGVARVSLGSAGFSRAFGAFRTVAREVRETGDYGSSEGSMPYSELNGLMKR